MTVLFVHNTQVKLLLMMYQRQSRRGQKRKQKSDNMHSTQEAQVHVSLRVKQCDALHLCRKCETNTRVGHVELEVVLAHEDVSEDPDRSHRGRDVNAHDAGEALGLHLHDVVSLLQGVGLAEHGQGQVGQGVGLRAHLVDALSCNVRLAAELGVDLLRHRLGEGKEGGTGVHHGLDRGSDRGSVEGDVVSHNLPVSLLRHRHPREVTNVLGVVNVSEGQLSVGSVRGQVEGEHEVRDGTLLCKLEEWGEDSVHSNLRPSHSEDSVEVGSVPGDTRLLGRLSEVHGCAKSTHREDVTVSDSLKPSASVLDRPLGSVGHVGRGLLGVVTVLSEDLGEDSGHPQVRASGVEDHLEVLWGCSDSDGTVVLGVLEVGDRDGGRGGSVLLVQHVVVGEHRRTGRLRLRQRHLHGRC